jgi:beta-glucosidase
MPILPSLSSLSSRVAVLLTLAAIASGCGMAPHIAQPTPFTATGTLEAKTLGSGAFPAGFLWGVATAGFQYEGGDRTSNWAVWEHQHHTSQPIGNAIGDWDRFEEDLDLTKELGLNSYRFSLEWAKLEPDHGHYDPVAVKHYHDVLAGCRARGLEPIVTVLHFSYPAWLDDQAGSGKSAWEDDRMLGEFERFAGFAAKEYGADVKWWITINEPNTVGTMGFLKGAFPPGKHDPFAYNAMMERQVRAHKLAYTAIHANDPDAQVSLCPPVMGMRSKDGTYLDSRLEGIRTTLGLPSIALPTIYLNETSVLDQLAPRKGTNGPSYLDYMAFNYYYLAKPQDFLTSSFDHWPVYPEGLYETTTRLYGRFGLPIMITENGMATVNDSPRPDGWTREAFIVNHLAQLRRAAADGVPLLGYMHWSLVDNYEWGSYAPRFGLYAIDRRDPTLRRIKTTGADVYRTIALANGIPVPTLDRYLGRRN